jgi:hypothetical protein
MVTMVGISNDYKTVIRELLELEYDAIDACKAASRGGSRSPTGTSSKNSWATMTSTWKG